MSISHKTLTLRLSSIQNRPENKTCCECSCSNPSWAFLVKSPLSGAQEDDHLGAFICYACSTAHKKLGESRCIVKSIAVGSCKWTSELLYRLRLCLKDWKLLYRIRLCSKDWKHLRDDEVLLSHRHLMFHLMSMCYEPLCSSRFIFFFSFFLPLQGRWLMSWPWSVEGMIE